ncbi:hypothetical protein EZV62_010489 [Acer yangbiense]|uniref:Uncharacterized protein n=1 Tax=Acer yangbiense TaxID=1000413 RepID=A0A5C7I312_9ROSI|nr:hypothetical protein EZV62_010489 [Acer yangbiense]
MVLSNVDDRTEEKIDQVVKRFLEDAKEGLLENNGWPVNLSSYVVSKAALNAYTRILAKKIPKISINAQDDKRGREAIKTLNDSGFSYVVFHQLDLMDPSSIG